MKALFKLMAAGIVVCGIAFASPAHAQMGWDGMRGKFKKKMEKRMDKVFAELNLSEEQKKLLEQNKLRHKEVSEGLGKDIKASMKAMEEEFSKEQLDINKIEAIHAGTKTLRNKMMDEQFHAILEVRKILTREQFLKFTELIKQRKDTERGHDQP